MNSEQFLIKSAAIESDLQNLGVTDGSLLRFAIRFESKIKTLRNQLMGELQTSQDPNNTFRAFIKVFMLNPLLQKFLSENLADHLQPRPDLLRFMQQHNISLETKRQEKLDANRAWANLLQNEYADHPEFAFTLITDIMKDYGPNRINAIPVPLPVVVADIFEMTTHSAEKAMSRLKPGYEKTDEDAEFENQIREANQEESALAKTLTDQGMDPNQDPQIKLLRRRAALLNASISRTGENLKDLYEYQLIEQNKKEEEERALDQAISGRWRKVPRIGQMEGQFTTDEIKQKWLAKVFARGTACLNREYGFQTYCSVGDVWVLMDQGNAEGLVAIALRDGNKKVRQFNNSMNQEPFEFIQEIRTFVNNHPEIDFTFEGSETGPYGKHTSVKEWLERQEGKSEELKDPKHCVELAFEIGFGEVRLTALNRIRSWSEREWRYVTAWFNQKMQNNDVASITSALESLINTRVRKYQSFTRLVDKLQDYLGAPNVMNVYMKYIAQYCERRAAIEAKMQINNQTRAHLIAEQGRCGGQVTPEGKKEMLEHPGTFDEYVKIPGAPPCLGAEMVGLYRSFVRAPDKAMQLIMQLHREGGHIDGIAPGLLAYIRSDAHLSAAYAIYVRHGRFKDGEEAISKDPGATAFYAGSLLGIHRGYIPPQMRANMPRPIRDAIFALMGHKENNAGGRREALP